MRIPFSHYSHNITKHVLVIMNLIGYMLPNKVRKLLCKQKNQKWIILLAIHLTTQ